MKLALMGFGEGTGLTEHAAPGKALVMALEGKAVITYEGTDHLISAGEASFLIKAAVMRLRHRALSRWRCYWCLIEKAFRLAVRRRCRCHEHDRHRRLAHDGKLVLCGFLQNDKTRQGVHESRSLGRVLHFFMDSVWRGRGAALFRLLCVPAFYLGHKFP